MRKLFCGISVFLFLCILSLGYVKTYQIVPIGPESAGEEGLTARSPDEQGTSIQEENTGIFHQPGETQLVSSLDAPGYGKYFLKESEGLVAVYRQDKTTLFEPTTIQVASLPKKLQEEIRRGKFLKSEKELYSFLENYSC